MQIEFFEVLLLFWSNPRERYKLMTQHGETKFLFLDLPLVSWLFVRICGCSVANCNHAASILYVFKLFKLLLDNTWLMIEWLCVCSRQTLQRVVCPQGSFGPEAGISYSWDRFFPKMSSSHFVRCQENSMWDHITTWINWCLNTNPWVQDDLRSSMAAVPRRSVCCRQLP